MRILKKILMTSSLMNSTDPGFSKRYPLLLESGNGLKVCLFLIEKLLDKINGFANKKLCPDLLFVSPFIEG